MLLILSTQVYTKANKGSLMSRKINLLAKYLDEEGIIKTLFAKKIGVSSTYLHKMLNKENFVPSLKIAQAIEKATHGKLPMTIWLSNGKESKESE